MDKPVAYIGADPGVSGALALFSPGSAVAIKAIDMYVFQIDGKRQIDHWWLAGLLEGWSTEFNVCAVAVERVHSMPKQGVSSSFLFGESFGALKQAIVSAGLPLTLVTPSVWKAIYGLRGGAENKDMSRQKASQIFPSYAHLWARKKDDGRAEAVLLAHYAWKMAEAVK